jgi:glycerol-3-phosphate dehydrogenase (NAD+)
MKRVGVIGSGNWGTTIARVISENVVNQEDFEDTVKMWVYDELVNGESLVKIINSKHENVKYLPGYKLPENLIAVPDLVEVSEWADFLVFVVPHQFAKNILETMEGHVKKTAVAISLTKGISFKNGEIELLTDMIGRTLNIKVGALMGANIANDIASRDYCESTLSFPDCAIAQDWARIIQTDYFRIATTSDITGSEVFGTLKNIVALAGGIVDGLGKGQSTKAAILRQGTMEILKFAKWAFPDRKVELQTMMESCGIGDIIASSYGGRNRKCGEHFAKTGMSFAECEKILLNGQKLQGTLSAGDVYTYLKRKNALSEFPFLTTVYLIVKEKVQANQIFRTNGPHLTIMVDQ